MEQYIPKSALIAEIRKRLLPVISDKHYDEWEKGRDSERIAILDIINTLEVKEVDLEKEIKKVQYQYKTIGDYDGYPATVYANDIETIAKHFFELGLAQKGE